MSASRTPVDVASPGDILDGHAETLRQLISDFGVTVEWMDLLDDVGQWNGPSRRVIIDRSSPIAAQAWFALQIWQLLVLGSHAVPAAQARDRVCLELVR